MAGLCEGGNELRSIPLAYTTKEHYRPYYKTNLRPAGTEPVDVICAGISRNNPAAEYRLSPWTESNIPAFGCLLTLAIIAENVFCRWDSSWEHAEAAVSDNTETTRHVRYTEDNERPPVPSPRVSILR
ncbi:hypothetical protein ANN_13356 [Periplaneta americana]|uniref:Uncharacterized protein n=1 Tax=Periplaneta americana TaxID=6978 RepID=A0ABQ8TL97_PERAM|nr:hypothetical protein ANN_13356 [Periplaneta americana]